MKFILAILISLFSSMLFAQSQTKRALFLGNSYTGVNNLPQMVADAAAAMGDTLIFESNTPGGETLQGHYLYEPVSIQKIEAGNWDYVVLQEQSQYPSFPIGQVESDVFPYAHKLDSVINLYNPCGETVFYMTWGRKNGDAYNCSWWPPVCTYNGMDSLLNLRYRMMADSNDALLSPVGVVWHYIREHYPSIELYQVDESHPSMAGSYAAACSFYATLFRRDPTFITYNPSLPANDAANIRNAARQIVFDSPLEWHIGEYDPVANYTYLISDSNQITFSNSSENAETYAWYFGDGDSSSLENPIHTYSVAGSYSVTLIATNCSMHDTITQLIGTSSSGSLLQNESMWDVYPNPANAIITIGTTLPSPLRYAVFNLMGKEIQSAWWNEREKQIDIASLPDGLYFLQLFHNNQPLGLQKFIKSAN